MSDSEGLFARPIDTKINTAFVKTITHLFKSGDLENLTLKRVRKAVEDELDLSENWFKEHDVWNAKSKELITNEVQRLEELGSDGEKDEGKPVVKKKSTPAKVRQKRKKPEGSSAKRKVSTKPKPRKKRKASSDEEDELSEEEQSSSLSEEEPTKPVAKKSARSKPTPKAKTTKIVDSDNNKEDEHVEDVPKPVMKKATKAKAASKVKAKRVVDSNEEEDSDMEESPKPVAKKPAIVKAAPRTKAKKVVDSDDEDLEMEESPKLVAKKPAASKAAPKTKLKDLVDSDDEDVEMADKAVIVDSAAVEALESEAEILKPAPVTKPTVTHTDGNASSSSLSSLLDEPVRKKREKKTPGAAKSTKSAKASKAASSKPKKAAKEIGPDEEEIKKLQGWLVKCGIRKVWGKELMPFSTSKAKISHLKSMLADAGMTGRFSNEKAASIKEARELAADLEAVQDFDTKWGTKEEKERPKRRNMAQDLGLDASLIDSGSDEDD